MPARPTLLQKRLEFKAFNLPFGFLPTAWVLLYYLHSRSDMAGFEPKEFPSCAVDYSLEIGEEEISTLASSINLLLKSTFLLGSARDLDGTFQSMFDIAEEIASVDVCGYIPFDPETEQFRIAVSRSLPLSDFADPSSPLLYIAHAARHFGKILHVDPGEDPKRKALCEPWGAGSLVSYPIHRNRETIGALVFGKRNGDRFSRGQVKLLWVLAHHAESLLAQTEAVQELSFYSFLDPLTHLYNRRFFDQQLEKEILRSRRNGNPFSLLMLDLDGFKDYNDRFLHQAGDIALQEYATVLSDSIREVDTVSRVGGDEFAVILVESSAEGVRDLCRRILDRIEKHLLPGVDGVRTERLTASIGVASFPSDSFDKQDLLAKSDRALYMAKSQGGGKLCLFHEISDLLSVQAAPGDLPVQKVYDAARSVVDMDKFLEILLFTAMQGLSASRGSIVVLDPEGKISIRTAVGFNNGENHLLAGTSVPPGEITSWVLAHRKPLVASGKEDLPIAVRWKKNGYRSESFLSIPLLLGDRLLGALHLTNRKDGRPFTREDLAAFEPIAGEIARVLNQGMEFRENVRTFSTSILSSLSSALELRFPFLKGHFDRVTDLSLRIGRNMNLSETELKTLKIAASLHDIGMVGLPGAIFTKKRRLSERELEIARKHPFLGAKLMEGVPGVEAVRRVILEHQEFWDGSGYPHGLRGEEISLPGRILSLAEYYDSILSERPHRGALRHEEAAQIIRSNVGKLFDEKVCESFFRIDLPAGS